MNLQHAACTRRESAETQGRLRMREVAAYGLGGFTGTMPNQFRLQFSMSFMTDVAGLPIGAVGLWSMLLSIWDAINDPLIGILVDRTNTPWGRYRPHMIVGALCWAVTIVLLFTVPDFSQNGRLLYYIIVLALFSVFYTQFSIPWQALNSVMTQDSHQRNVLLTARQLVGAVATSSVGLFAIPIVSRFADPRSGWLASAGVVAFVCALCALFAANSAKRFDKCRPACAEKKHSLFTQICQTLKNKAVFCVSLLLGVVNLAISINAAISIYYLKYIVGDVGLLTVISLIKIIVTVAFMLFLPVMLRRFGKPSVLAAGMAAQALAAIPLFFLRESAANWQVIAMSTVTTLGLTYANSCCFAMVPDCVDYTRLHFGSAQVGFINATGTFVRKLCGSFATLIVGGLLAVVGYHADAVITQDVQWMILWIKIWLPIILLVLTLLLLRLYPITKAYGEAVRRKLAEEPNE